MKRKKLIIQRAADSNGIDAVVVRRIGISPQKNPDHNAYFGEEHIHTSWSVDAWLMGNRLTGPDDAYQSHSGPDHQAPARFGKITTIPSPMYLTNDA